MPGFFGDDADRQPEFFFGPGIAVLNENVPALQMAQHLVQQALEVFFRNGNVDVAPPDIVLGGVFLDDEAVVGGSPGMRSRQCYKRAPLRQHAFAAV